MAESEATPDVKTTHVEVFSIDAVASRATARHFELISDEKPWNGGQDRGPSPLEYLLTSLGS
jgi:uncharacterized OsmC-like protein